MADDYHFKMGKNFEKIIETQLKRPEIAILELISNSWDANAHNVYIKWPIIENLRESTEYFTILDGYPTIIISRSAICVNTDLGNVRQMLRICYLSRVNSHFRGTDCHVGHSPSSQ